MASPDPGDLARWSEALSAIARTGLGFSDNLYERERFEEVLHIAADIRAAAADLGAEGATRRETDHFVQEWMANIGEGVPGYITPKVAIGAIVGNDQGQLLLVQRRDSGIWLYPTGWADVGYSAAVSGCTCCSSTAGRWAASCAPIPSRRPMSAGSMRVLCLR